MVTYSQMGTCRELERAGLKSVRLYHGVNSPLPGLILFSDEAHGRLIIVQPDGSIVDLLDVHRLAEDLIRNWHQGTPKWIPHFVGDFGRLTKLAQALNGSNPCQPTPTPEKSTATSSLANPSTTAASTSSESGAPEATPAGPTSPRT